MPASAQSKPDEANTHTTAGAAGLFPLRRLRPVRVLSLIQQADAPMGTFADVIRDRGDELLEWTVSNGPPPEDPKGFDAAFVLGGAMHVDQEGQHPWLRHEHEAIEALLAAEVPTFGVCLGAQLLAQPEAKADPIFGELPQRFQALQWHSYAFQLPPRAVALATSAACLQAYRLGERAWGVQFHPEVNAPILEGWLGDPEARGKGFEGGPMESWGRLGQGLAARFLALAAQLPPRSRRAATRAS
jgi:GMP synthase (glutamine-hydrolysing)